MRRYLQECYCVVSIALRFLEVDWSLTHWSTCTSVSISTYLAHKTFRFVEPLLFDMYTETIKELLLLETYILCMNELQRQYT